MDEDEPTEERLASDVVRTLSVVIDVDDVGLRRQKIEEARDEDEPTEEQLKLLAEVHEEVCYQCGALADRFEPDPYESEVNGNHEPRWMCKSCYREAENDI